MNHKSQNSTEVVGGGLIAVLSWMADVTELVQMIGVWAGCLLALLGIYSWFEKRFKS